MRDIKFKAWHKRQNKMYPAEEMGLDELTINPDGRGFVNVSNTPLQLSVYITGMIPLQYTGLKDKNDVEIYEDDLVCIFRVYTHKVIFQDGAFGYITNDDFIPFGHNCYFNWINGKSDDIEVVGNVHDDK